MGGSGSAEVLSRPILSHTLAAAPPVQVRGAARTAALQLEEGALGQEPQRGRDPKEPSGGRGAGDVFVVGDRDPTRLQGKGGEATPDRVCVLERILQWFCEGGRSECSYGSVRLRESGGREGTDRRTGKGLESSLQIRVSFHLLCFSPCGPKDGVRFTFPSQAHCEIRGA